MHGSSVSLDFSAVAGELRAAGCVFAEDEARLLVAEARTEPELARMVRQRVSGQPLEYVLGWARFADLRIAVEPGVFVPRRRTELLVREAAELARRHPAAVHGDAAEGASSPPILVVDLCCGSGALGVALAVAVGAGRVELHAADIDPAAVACARRNLALVGGRVHQGDLYAALPDELRGCISILMANLPYVPTGDIALLPPEAREHEPRVALDGGADGLDLLRRAAAEAPLWLAPGGSLLIETSERQAPRAERIMIRSGLIPRVVEWEELDATAVVATRPEV
jgi:release factor glutamine methyltransferase